MGQAISQISDAICKVGAPLPVPHSDINNAAAPLREKKRASSREYSNVPGNTRRVKNQRNARATPSSVSESHLGAAHASISAFTSASISASPPIAKALAGGDDVDYASSLGSFLAASCLSTSAPIGIRKALAIGTSGSTAFGSWVPPVERLETLNTLKSAAPVMSEDSTGTPEVSFLIAHQAP
jgi:hypothetical protein